VGGCHSLVVGTHRDGWLLHAHTRLCLPFTQLRNLAQLRIGCAHLDVEQGRKRSPKVPRPDRLCKLCSGEDAPLARRLAAFSRTGTSRNVEDLKHFFPECPVYVRVICLLISVERAIARFIEMSRVGEKASGARQ